MSAEASAWTIPRCCSSERRGLRQRVHRERLGRDPREALAQLRASCSGCKTSRGGTHDPASQLRSHRRARSPPPAGARSTTRWAALIASHSDIERIACASSTERISSSSKISRECCWSHSETIPPSGADGRDKTAAGPTGLEQPERLKTGERLAHDRPRDAELFNEIALGRQPVSGGEVAVEDPRADRLRRGRDQPQPSLRPDGSASNSPVSVAQPSGRAHRPNATSSLIPRRRPSAR